MIRTLINNWWLLALRGIFALMLSIFALSLQPLEESFVTRAIVHMGIVIVFGVLALGAGACTIAAAVRRASNGISRLLLWDGIAVCVAGSIIMVAPRLDLVWLVYIVAVWAMIVGLLEILVARGLRRHIPDEWSLTLAGLGSFVLGAYFLLEPGEDGASMLVWLGIYAGFSAIAILALALRLYALRASIHELAGCAELAVHK
jgi:uncharacterized membrane protein HdeD (DUF308 family)